MKIEEIYNQALEKMNQHNIWSAAKSNDKDEFYCYFNDIFKKILSEVIAETQEEAEVELRAYYEPYDRILKENIIERLPVVEKCLNYKKMEKPADYECGICWNCAWKYYRLKVLTAINNGKQADDVPIDYYKN